MLMYHVIDPDLRTMVNEMSQEKALSWMEKMGTPQEAIDKQMAKMSEEDQTSVGNNLFGLAMALIFGFFISLIISLIVRKNPPLDVTTQTAEEVLDN
jgi:hypothetical protein